ncbi:hypothetical protein HYQ45_011283 [Verticillium longisporum]|uniref:Uncharacterized protein n=1 Tax=Verticillium longisporum TaxID=100787 RepID=A0A8I2ZG86_VERLO|nr:hypothetical protein HYQ45_011283 [Verticillium longisporum]
MGGAADKQAVVHCDRRANGGASKNCDSHALFAVFLSIIIHLRLEQVPKYDWGSSSFLNRLNAPRMANVSLHRRESVTWTTQMV